MTQPMAPAIDQQLRLPREFSARALAALSHLPGLFILYSCLLLSSFKKKKEKESAAEPLLISTQLFTTAEKNPRKYTGDKYIEQLESNYTVIKVRN